MTTLDTLRSVLEALEYHVAQTRPIECTSKAITDMTALIADMEDAGTAREPVGHIYTIAGVQHCTIEKVLPDGPLYTAPQARPLTDEQIEKLWYQGVTTPAT
jgi:hypothetical protein